jgi:hypothetical protein
LNSAFAKLAAGNPLLEAATEPMLWARLSLRQELAGLDAVSTSLLKRTA